MKSILLTLTLISFTVVSFAQTNVRFTLNHQLGNQAFAFDQQAQNDKSEAFKLNRLEYYISAISLTHDGGQVTEAKDVYILVDASKTDTIDLGSFNATNIESITFSVGVDPSVNNEDPTIWAAGHPLAPRMPSMHWGWASGYRFVALEGKSGTSLNQELQIHALGNKNFFTQNIPVEPSTVDGDLVITLNADYEKALSGISIANGLIEHSENGAAITCLKNFYSHVFTNKDGEGNTLNVESRTADMGFNVFPNPTNGQILISSKGFQNAAFEVFNAQGQLVQKGLINGSSKSINLNETGMYFVRIATGKRVIQKKVLVL